MNASRADLEKATRGGMQAGLFIVRQHMGALRVATVEDFTAKGFDAEQQALLLGAFDGAAHMINAMYEELEGTAG